MLFIASLWLIVFIGGGLHLISFACFASPPPLPPLQQPPICFLSLFSFCFVCMLYFLDSMYRIIWYSYFCTWLIPLSIICPACMCAKSLQSCPTLQSYGSSPTRLLCPWDSLGKNSALSCHTLLQGSSWLRDQTWVSCIADRLFTLWATRESPLICCRFIQIVKNGKISFFMSEYIVMSYVVYYILIHLSMDH